MLTLKHKQLEAYYPDFLIKKEDGSYVIIEIKGDNKLGDKVVARAVKRGGIIDIASSVISQDNIQGGM